VALRLKFRPCTADISVVRLGDMALDMCPPPLRTRGCARARLHTRAPSRRRRFGRGEPSPGADVGAGEPSPGADVAAVEPSPGADVAWASPVPAQIWEPCTGPLLCTDRAFRPPSLHRQTRLAVTGYPAEYPDCFRYYIGSGRLVSDMEEDANHFVEASSHLGRFPLGPHGESAPNLE
jgi:hypothetical protein